MPRIALVGSRELASRLIHYVETTGFGLVTGLFDDFESPGTVRLGKPILGSIAAAPACHARGDFDAALIAIGYDHFDVRQRAFDELRAAGVPFATFVHPRATIDPTVTLGSGTVVLANCTIDLHSRIGENVYVAPQAFISHDVEIGAHCYLSASIALAGRTRVGQRCFLGIGTITINGITIGDGSHTGAGAVVVKDVPPGVLVVGVPAVVKRAAGGTAPDGKAC
jgi:sugar O-acyltransferase (sialic acid O-acetyltransferase NeuD family)